MSGYYGYTSVPTDIEELWTEIRKLRTRVSDLEKELRAQSHSVIPYPVKDLDA